MAINLYFSSTGIAFDVGKIIDRVGVAVTRALIRFQHGL
jgi:hypothetical protein